LFAGEEEGKEGFVEPQSQSQFPRSFTCRFVELAELDETVFGAVGDEVFVDLVTKFSRDSLEAPIC
jgi:hypothetical protein